MTVRPGCRAGGDQAGASGAGAPARSSGPVWLGCRAQTRLHGVRDLGRVPARRCPTPGSPRCPARAPCLQGAAHEEAAAGAWARAGAGPGCPLSAAGPRCLRLAAAPPARRSAGASPGARQRQAHTSASSTSPAGQAAGRRWQGGWAAGRSRRRRRPCKALEGCTSLVGTWRAAWV